MSGEQKTWTRIGRRRTLVAIAAAAVGSLAMAASAGATVTVTSFSATPSTTLAAAHPNFTTSIRVSYSNSTDDIKSVVTHLPPGLIGNPRAVAQCSIAQLNSDTCPAGSKIGTTATLAKVDLPLAPPLSATGDVYNVTPTGSEPARIGLVVRPVGGLVGKFAISGPATVRVPGDFGLDVTFDNLPRTLPALNGTLPIPVQVQGLDLTLNGLVNGGTAAFMTNPTSCIPATTTLAAASYEDATASNASSTFTPTDCAGVPFNPTVGFQFNTARANSPTSLLAAIFLPTTELPRAQAHIRDTITLLPMGTQINFAALANITPCTDAQFAQSSAAPPACPASSKIGQSAIVTPVLGTVVGDVFFAAGTPTQPLRLFLTLRITSTQTAKFVIVNSFTTTGAIRADLSNLPQVPQSLFVLGFNGGPNGLLKTPATCGRKYGSGIFTPWSGGPTKFNFAGIDITQNADGSPCSAVAAARVAAPALPSGLGLGR